MSVAAPGPYQNHGRQEMLNDGCGRTSQDPEKAIEERALEREERKKEREEYAQERELEREEREKEREERAQERATMATELGTIQAELKGVKEALEAEQNKVDALVEYMGMLFQFPDDSDGVADLNTLRNLVSCARQRLASVVNSKTATWWMALGPPREQSTAIRKP
ncbi:hypothetical protein BDZ97DRAFT_1914889 [Flammula alnicola]|nr:hypothetical protein BDZ97DRAFT_1914889 [Flammula alnicola]